MKQDTFNKLRGLKINFIKLDRKFKLIYAQLKKGKLVFYLFLPS